MSESDGDRKDDAKRKAQIAETLRLAETEDEWAARHFAEFAVECDQHRGCPRDDDGRLVPLVLRLRRGDVHHDCRVVPRMAPFAAQAILGRGA